MSSPSRSRPRPQLGRRAISGGLKFKHTSSNLSTFAFARDQVWVDKSKEDNLLFVDQNGADKEESRRRAQTRKRQRGNSQPSSSHKQIENLTQDTDLAITDELDFTIYDGNDIHQPLANMRQYSIRSPSIVSPERLPATEVAAHPKPPGSNAWSPFNKISCDEENANLYSWPSHFSAIESACLMRVHADLLAYWADAGYPERHFTITLHDRARSFPPLLHAMLASAAGHLLNASVYHTSAGNIEYHGVQMPGVTKEAVIRCHNSCIADLLIYCDENAGVDDDHVLIALTILRYHEELHSAADDGQDTGRLFRLFNSFFTARNLHDTPRSQDGTALSKEAYRTYLKSFRHAILRLALRQALTAAYIEQVPLDINLDLWLPLDDIEDEEIDESIWSDKCLLQCAKVINLCYDPNGGDIRPRWADLCLIESALESSCPNSFSPLHWEQNGGKAFPLIWYTNMLPITGMQWLGLSKLLLAVHNPNLPRIGPSIILAQEKLAEEVRRIIRTLCGIADSNPSVQPAYVQAQMAIVAGGAYFTDSREQSAMLAIFEHLENEFGWPTASNAARLRTIWHRNS